MLCVPKDCGCISAEYVPLPDDEVSLTNNILDSGFQFIYRHVYYNNIQASEWSEPSQLYYQDASSCFYNTKGESRCIKLSIPMGNPMIDKIEVAFTKGDKDEAGKQVWYLTDTIEKYKKYNNSQQFWYERSLREDITGCTVD